MPRIALLPGLLLFAAIGCATQEAAVSSAADAYLEAALETARWLESVAVVDATGRSWPMAPEIDSTTVTSLYSGTPGVVLFLLDLHAATGDPAYRSRALEGADALVAAMADEASPAHGLYTGRAGQCFTLWQVATRAASARHEAAARDCVGRVRDAAVPVGTGVAWGDVTDIISGTAGIGVTLLWAARELGDDAALSLAAAAGHRLLELEIETPSGGKWAMSPDFPRLMPNFSHGTAGIAYFLAALYSATGEDAFLQGALRGAHYLQSIAETDGDMCLVFHHEPEGEELFYLSWCHGPAGTARLFHALAAITGDPEWDRWTHKAARAVLASGIPEGRTPGYWNNVGQCCGAAGVVEFFVGLYGGSGRPEYLQFARRVAADILARARRDSGGLRWIHAEHRVRPDDVAAQTGYMQGASGIGSALLSLRATLLGAPPTIALPDSPFGSVTGGDSMVARSF